MTLDIQKPNSELNVALFDADGIPFVTCFNKKDELPKNMYDCIELTNNYINNILNHTGTDKYILCLTKGKCNYRLHYNPDYKANRKSAIPIPYSRTIKQFLIDEWGAISLDDYEADDIVLTLNRQIPNSFIISPDKDLLTTNGYRFNPKTLEWVHTSKYDETIAFWRSMITGDAADGIPGIKGRGPKYAQTILETYSESELPQAILKEYISVYGEESGISLYHSYYKSLKIRDDLSIGYELREIRKNELDEFKL